MGNRTQCNQACTNWIMICEPQELINAARCFKCLPRGMHKPVQIMLLANLIGCITPITPPCIVPPAPLDLSAVSGPGEITLTWPTSAGATSYNVKRSTVPGGPYVTIESPAASPYQDTTGVMGTTYYYVVSAVNSCGESGNSIESHALFEVFFFTPVTETVSWTDMNGNNSGNLAFFYSNADIPSTTTVSLIGTAITSISGLGSLPALQNFNVNACLSLLTISVGSLASLSGDFSCSGCTSLTTLDLPNVTHVGQIEFDSCPALTSVNLSSLASISASLQFPNDTSLDTLSLPALTSVGGNFDCNNCPSLPSLSVPSLTSIGGFLNVSGCSSMTSMSFNSITSIVSDITCDSCAALSSVSLPLLVVSNGTTVRFMVDALSQASVDSILSTCFASGVTTCTIILDGGTNSSPTGGMANFDYIQLIANGNTVSIN